FDSTSAMIYWAKALAYGPNINDFEYSAAPAAYSASQKAMTLSVNCSAKEKMLINAMAIRYSLDTSKKQTVLNKLYSAKMQEAYRANPNDEDVAALYADAMMIEHPWDYWKHDGTAQAWTPAITTVLEKLLKQDSLHPGANHYYIHMIEASPDPGKALPSANRLGKMMPGLSHVVHMPSHIYVRTGYYKEGEEVNEDAVTGFNKYLALYPDVNLGNFFYVTHNIHLQTANALMLGDYGYSMNSALKLRNSFDSSVMSAKAPMGTYTQWIYYTPLMLMVRYGKWQEILHNEIVPAQYAYGNAIWHWARGMAYAGENDMAAAKKELDLLKEQLKLPDMKVVYTPFNAPIDAAKIAVEILAGQIAFKESDYIKSKAHFKLAVIDEDALLYNEPADWLLPARQFLGESLQRSNPLEAEQIFREDLKQHPRNIWSQYGLYQSLINQKKHTEAASEKKLLNELQKSSDKPITAAAY
ncbi:MAG: hypothetical protein ABJA78_18955, partial [Ferruginibacter sp.]